jgi:DNA-binding NarL/FixJ family response regulator
MTRPRVLLADDHTLFLEALRKLLEPDCEVVGVVSHGRELLQRAPELAPDVIVLDIAMPRLNGLDAGRKLKAMLPDVKLIFLTVSEDAALAAEAARIGASAYLLKTSAASALFCAIRRAVAGDSDVTPLLAGPRPRAGNAGLPRAFLDLTSRQREVLQLLAEGYSMKEVAAELGVTPRTVAFHKYRLMGELGLSSNAELVQLAIRQGILAG